MLASEALKKEKGHCHSQAEGYSHNPECLDFQRDKMWWVLRKTISKNASEA
jgi:hypothetical protein